MMPPSRLPPTSIIRQPRSQNKIDSPLFCTKPPCHAQAAIASAEMARERTTSGKNARRNARNPGTPAHAIAVERGSASIWGCDVSRCGTSSVSRGGGARSCMAIALRIATHLGWRASGFCRLGRPFAALCGFVQVVRELMFLTRRAWMSLDHEMFALF